MCSSDLIKRVGGNVIAGTLTGGQSGTLTRSSGFESFVGLTFDWKVFDGGIRDAEANAKDARARQSMANGVQTRLQIGQQVEDAYATYVASRILVDAARADVSASRLSLDSALKDYASGRNDDAGTTVVQALSKLQSALSNYRDLVNDQNLSIHQLYRYTASWPERTEQLVIGQYQRWLPSSNLKLAPQRNSSVPGGPADLQIDATTMPSALSQPESRP